MRLLHTSDWHLGRTLHGVPLLEHQAAYLDHLVELARAERVAAVLVAGDVFDRAVPPAEAVEILTDALVRLAETTTVVVTPGNHDSAVRLGYLSPVLRERVRVRARLAEVGEPVVLPDDDGEVRIHALPYLDPDQARRELAEMGPDGGRDLLPRSHEAVMAAAMARVRADLAAHPATHPAAHPVRSVVMAHAFVVGGEASGSERDIRVGGVDSVPAGVFGGVDYVALGHLHGPQDVTFPRSVPDPVSDSVPDGAPPVLRYSGSPLAFSFAERHHRKSTTLVELTGRGVWHRAVPAPVPRRVAEVTGTLAELLGARGEPHVDDWLRAVVTDDVRPPGLQPRLRERFPHLLVVEHRPTTPAGHRRAAAVTAASDPLEVLSEFVEYVTGAPPTEAEAAVLRDAHERVLAEGRSA